MFHFCSHASGDARCGEEPWLEGPYALRGWVSAGNQVYEALRPPRAAGSRSLAVAELFASTTTAITTCT